MLLFGIDNNTWNMEILYVIDLQVTINSQLDLPTVMHFLSRPPAPFIQAFHLCAVALFKLLMFNQQPNAQSASCHIPSTCCISVVGDVVVFAISQGNNKGSCL